jgi:hypothetical protein
MAKLFAEAVSRESLPDTEFGKDHTENVIDTVLPGYPSEAERREPQRFGPQFESHTLFLDRLFQFGQRRTQIIDMPLPRRKRHHILSNRFAQMFPKRIDQLFQAARRNGGNGYHPIVFIYLSSTIHFRRNTPNGDGAEITYRFPTSGL